jgi:hypothetical protein
LNPVTGQCQCGSLKYTSLENPKISFHCQCEKCQKFSSTGHGSYILLDKSRTIVQGAFSSWSYEADSGNTTTKNFCPECGTHVFSLTSGHPNNFIGSAMTLDDKTHFRPSLVLFSQHAQRWDLLDSSLKRFQAGA